MRKIWGFENPNKKAKALGYKQDVDDFWTKEISGYEAYIWQHPSSLHLCGYVDVMMSEDEAMYLDVHGGITFNNGSRIGFDCAHYGDLCPGSFLGGIGIEVYRDVDYVHDQLVALVSQLPLISKE